MILGALKSNGKLFPAFTVLPPLIGIDADGSSVIVLVVNIKTILKLLMGICGASIVKGFRFGPKDFLFSSMNAYLSVTMGKVRGIPEKSFSTILEGTRLDLTVPATTGYERGSLPPHQILALLAILKANDPKAVLEIGTFMGATTKAIAQNLPNSIIHTVDLPRGDGADDRVNMERTDFDLFKKSQPGREFLGTPFASRIKQHFCDTAKWDFSEAEGATCFFIDGDHSYEFCKSDSEKCFDLCKGKGVFLWHDCDYFSLGVVRLIREWRAMGRDIVRIAETPLAY